MPNRAKSILPFGGSTGEVELDPDPNRWTAEDIAAITPPLPLPEDIIRQAVARFHFRVVKIERLPVHRIQIVRFTGRDKMGLYPRPMFP